MLMENFFLIHPAPFSLIIAKEKTKSKIVQVLEYTLYSPKMGIKEIFTLTIYEIILLPI